MTKAAQGTPRRRRFYASDVGTRPSRRASAAPRLSVVSCHGRAPPRGLAPAASPAFVASTCSLARIERNDAVCSEKASPRNAFSGGVRNLLSHRSSKHARQHTQCKRSVSESPRDYTGTIEYTQSYDVMLSSASMSVMILSSRVLPTPRRQPPPDGATTHPQPAPPQHGGAPATPTSRAPGARGARRRPRPGAPPRARRASCPRARCAGGAAQAWCRPRARRCRRTARGARRACRRGGRRRRGRARGARAGCRCAGARVSVAWVYGWALLRLWVAVSWGFRRER